MKKNIIFQTSIFGFPSFFHGVFFLNRSTWGFNFAEKYKLCTLQCQLGSLFNTTKPQTCEGLLSTESAGDLKKCHVRSSDWLWGLYSNLTRFFLDELGLPFTRVYFFRSNHEITGWFRATFLCYLYHRKGTTKDISFDSDRWCLPFVNKKHVMKVSDCQTSPSDKPMYN